MTEQSEDLRISRLNAVSTDGDHYVIAIEMPDGRSAYIRLPTRAAGSLIEMIHRAALAPPNGFPDLTVLGIDALRDQNDRLVLRMHTQEAHTIFGSATREVAEALAEQLDDFDRLPLDEPQRPS